ncbi:MAG: hypothetical protein HQL08_09540 [Nitrospirae bacterium]|nr:hypothetical protein [Nitrospirota bacterium]
MTSAIDTLKLYERLKAAELPDKAARELAEAFKETEQSRLEELTTKKDLSQELAKLEVRLIKWILGTGIGVVTAVFAFLKLIVK